MLAECWLDSLADADAAAALPDDALPPAVRGANREKTLRVRSGARSFVALAEAHARSRETTRQEDSSR